MTRQIDALPKPPRISSQTRPYTSKNHKDKPQTIKNKNRQIKPYTITNKEASTTIKRIIKKENINMLHQKKDGIQVHLETTNGFRKLLQILDEQEQEYHIYELDRKSSPRWYYEEYHRSQHWKKSRKR